MGKTIRVSMLVLAAFVACARKEAAGAAPAPPPGARADAKAESRKVIQTAELWLEAEHPAAVKERLTALAAAKGGFVLSAETSRVQEAGGAEWATLSLVFRVPSAAFDEVLASVEAMGTRVSNERITGQDVTEEYVDLEARLGAQRAVEASLLRVLESAKTVHDILEVQTKLGDVRTEIDRAEGRRRYLESQVSLATFTIHLARELDAVDASGPGFGRSAREAAHDVLAVGVAIINGAIRLAGVLIPVGVLVVLPGYGSFRFWRRRRKTDRGRPQ